MGRTRLGLAREARPRMRHRTWPGADSQTRTGHRVCGGVCRSRYKTSDPGDSQSHSAGSAWVRPQAQPCETAGSRGQAPSRAPLTWASGMAVSVLQVGPRVKRKARDSDRHCSGGERVRPQEAGLPQLLEAATILGLNPLLTVASPALVFSAERGAPGSGFEAQS